MAQPSVVARGAATDHFDRDSLEVLRPRVAGLDVRKLAITATVRLCEPGLRAHAGGAQRAALAKQVEAVWLPGGTAYALRSDC